jgi:hypothetical protein
MFSKKDRATFKYTFAHWCAYNMTALNLGVWKWRYLLHDIEKPFLKLFLKDYTLVQKHHRNHNKHHVEYYLRTGKCDFDGMVIDYECSRFTKSAHPLNAMQEFQHKVMQLLTDRVDSKLIVGYYCGMRKALKNANLWNDMEDPYNAFSDVVKEMIINQK